MGCKSEEEEDLEDHEVDGLVDRVAGPVRHHDAEHAELSVEQEEPEVGSGIRRKSRAAE